MLAATIEKVKAVAPYVLISLLVPGGLMLALVLWFHRLPKKLSVFLI
jgi:hypothetical protein